MIRDNQELAILTRVNELADRHGLKPFHFSATVRYDQTRDLTTLDFEHIDRDVGPRADAMLDLLDPTRADEGHFEGTPRDLLTALDLAIARSPKPRGRERL